MTAIHEHLTEAEYWDAYWANLKLPSAHTRRPGQLYINEILDIFARFLPHDPSLRVLEIGGAPGAYLAYVHEITGGEIHCLDYSAVGCEKARENFRLLGIDGHVHHADLFADALDVSPFDVVYSLGLIEHFADLEDVVARHLAMLKPGGTLILGVPNFLGINHFFLKRLAPDLLASHNLPTMNIENWKRFEAKYGLDVKYRGYVGGFEPGVFARYPNGRATVYNRLLYKLAALMEATVGHRLGVLRRLNGKYHSGYAMAAYRKPIP